MAQWQKWMAKMNNKKTPKSTLLTIDHNYQWVISETARPLRELEMCCLFNIF